MQHDCIPPFGTALVLYSHLLNNFQTPDHIYRQSHRFHCPLTVCHYLSSSPYILIDPDRTNPTVQIAIHPHRFQVQAFIFSAGKYSGI
ncbi:hypothetical protein ACN38_g12463 [Penicillium nordicum]|uniref:Uncharacterized protein n=1 Tax=Penicillium nordicum TaxID=229535 RepID=A0A0M8NX75_9EURO|nr:hypothetical protein ACN38_g12463 [Penicillium nordicum]